MENLRPRLRLDPVVSASAVVLAQQVERAPGFGYAAPRDRVPATRTIQSTDVRDCGHPSIQHTHLCNPAIRYMQTIAADDGKPSQNVKVQRGMVQINDLDPKWSEITNN